jgi:hypothetical protein
LNHNLLNAVIFWNGHTKMDQLFIDNMVSHRLFWEYLFSVCLTTRFRELDLQSSPPLPGSLPQCRDFQVKK